MGFSILGIVVLAYDLASSDQVGPVRSWENGGLAFLLVGLVVVGAGSLFLTELVSAPPGYCYDWGCVASRFGLGILLGFVAISGIAMCIYGAVSYYKTGRTGKGRGSVGDTC